MYETAFGGVYTPATPQSSQECRYWRAANVTYIGG